MIYFIVGFVLLADQLTKLWAVSALPVRQFVPVLPFFNLFLTFNTGVSFSFLSMENTYGPWILSALSLGICSGILYWIVHENNRFVQAALALVLGGAISNVVDRVRIGSVIDFLDFYYHSYHWPAFNVADTAICCGAGLLLLNFILQKKEKK